MVLIQSKFPLSLKQLYSIDFALLLCVVYKVLLRTIVFDCVRV